MEKMIGIKKRTSPMLRTTYPIVAHPLDGERADWFQKRLRKGAFLQEKMPKQLELTDWYFQKRRELHALFAVKEWLKK